MKDCSDNKKMSMLTNAALTLIACAENIQETTETIIQSLGMKGTDYESMPKNEKGELEALLMAYNSVARRLKDAAGKVVEGKYCDETLAGVSVYGLFLIDQLRIEERDFHQAFNILQESFSGNTDKENE